jgi:hypothetical protein
MRPKGDYEDDQEIQYRVLKPGTQEIYKQEANKNPVLHATYRTSIPVIPLVPLYTGQTGVFQSDPPLLDFCYENLRHFRLQSDLDNILHVANVPILKLIGRENTKEPIVIGSNAVIDLPTGGDAAYTEHSGTAIGSAQEEIQNSKRNMATLGLALLTQKQVQTTATETVIDYEAESSQLATFSRSAQDSFELALYYHALYLNQASGGHIQLNRDFGPITVDAGKVQVFSELVAKGQLGLETMWAILERGGELPDGFDAKAEAKTLEDKSAVDRLATRAQTFKLLTDGGASIPAAAKVAGFTEAEARMLMETDIPDGITQ